jgi:hypothetical protein
MEQLRKKIQTDGDERFALFGAARMAQCWILSALLKEYKGGE